MLEQIRTPTRITIKDISAAAGVSTATVSRMLNAPHLVSDEIRGRIEAVIAKTGYTPNVAARTLRARRSWTMGALVPKISSPLYARMLDAFKVALEERGYDLFVSSFDMDAPKVRARVERFVERGVDAVFVGSIEPDAAVARLLESNGIPFVTTWLPEAAFAAPRIFYDHRAAAAKPAQYLLDLGHRHFGIVTGARTRNRRLQERYDAVVAALIARGVDAEDIGTVDVHDYDLRSGREALRTLLRQSRAPTAVIASNDILAAGVIFECHARQLSVPQDISVTGFGDLDIAQYFHPPISSVRTPRDRVGTLAAEYLLARIDKERPSSDIQLDSEFIVRASAGIPSVVR